MTKTLTRIPTRIFAALIVMLGISRCSTTSERSEFGIRAPNSVSVDETSGRDPASVSDPATRAVLAYRLATLALKAGQNVEACEGFRNLAMNSSLKLPEPVRLLARVRALPVCPPERALPVAQPPKWLEEDFARANLEIAQRLKLPAPLATALRDVAAFEKTQKLRVSRLQESLTLWDQALRAAPRNADLENERALTSARLVTVAPRFALEDTQQAMDALKDPQAQAVDSLIIAQDLRNARQFDRARKLYDSVVRDSSRTPQERLRALDGLRMSFKLQLKTAEFIRETHVWQTFAKKHFLIPGLKRRDSALLKTYLDTRIQYARAIWTDHRPSDAKKILLETEKQIAGRISVHESMLIRARIAEEAGDFNETAAILYQVPINSLPDRATKARFLWYKGWNLRRLAQPTAKREAITALELAQTFEDRHSDLTRNMYWTARLYKQIGDAEKARQLFTDLADFSPFGFYGITAQRELGLPFQSLKSSLENAYNSRTNSPVPDSIRVPVDWFVVLGEHDVGRRYVESFPLRDVWDTSFSLERKEATLVMFSRLEQHIWVSTRVDELLPEDRKRLLLKRPELIFPLPFESRIMSETTRQNLPPALVYSIMRQESLFNVFARSPADAFGLMQLIPEMAAVAAKSLGVEFHGPEDLYDPDKNIALGTVFLKDLFKKYNDQFILAVAAYNANDRAIQGWVRSRMRADPLEFIEEIPYDETRLYVKLVLRNFVTYQRRMSVTPVEFPENLLRLPSSPSTDSF